MENKAQKMYAEAPQSVLLVKATEMNQIMSHRKLKAHSE